MAKALKGKWIDKNIGIIECPHCGKRTMVNAQSKYLPTGELRQRYSKTLTCVECGNKYKMR